MSSTVKERQHFYFLGRGYKEDGDLENAIDAFKMYSTVLKEEDKHIPYLWISQMYEELDDKIMSCEYLEKYANGCSDPLGALKFKEVGHKYKELNFIGKAIECFELAESKSTNEIGVKKILKELRK